MLWDKFVNAEIILCRCGNFNECCLFGLLSVEDTRMVYAY